MDEQTQSTPAEELPDDDQREERFDRGLTQRELVRASLLRCPPEPSDHQSP